MDKTSALYAASLFTNLLVISLIFMSYFFVFYTKQYLNTQLQNQILKGNQTNTNLGLSLLWISYQGPVQNFHLKAQLTFVDFLKSFCKKQGWQNISELCTHLRAIRAGSFLYLIISSVVIVSLFIAALHSIIILSVKVKPYSYLNIFHLIPWPLYLLGWILFQMIGHFSKLSDWKQSGGVVVLYLLLLVTLLQFVLDLYVFLIRKHQVGLMQFNIIEEIHPMQDHLDTEREDLVKHIQELSSMLDIQEQTRESLEYQYRMKEKKCQDQMWKIRKLEKELEKAEKSENKEVLKEKELKIKQLEQDLQSLESGDKREVVVELEQKEAQVEQLVQRLDSVTYQFSERLVKVEKEKNMVLEEQSRKFQEEIQIKEEKISELQGVIACSYKKRKSSSSSSKSKQQNEEFEQILAQNTEFLNQIEMLTQENAALKAQINTN